MSESYPIKEVLSAYGISPKKALGQNFLNDVSVVRDIVSCAEITKDDIVLEVGPGLGIMTNMLAEAAGYAVAVELDSDMMGPLNALTKVHPNLEIVQGDILKINVGDLFDRIQAESGLSNIKVVANLPYYITTPIIMMFLEQYASRIDSLTFMIQKEVADRLTSDPACKEYGAITVAVNYFSKAEKMLDVGAHCFVPRPNVDSAVVRLSVYKNPPFVLKDKDYFFKVVRASFCQRRKMLSNSLANAPYLGISRDDVTSSLDKLGISATIRGENLTPEQFGMLSNELFDRKQAYFDEK